MKVPDSGGFYADPEDRVEKLIRFKAWELCREYGFTGSDREDIEQQLRLAVAIAIRMFDPQRGSRQTFLRRVVQNEIGDIRERRSAACRSWKVPTVPIHGRDDRDPDNHSLIETLGGPDPGEQLALRIDLGRALANESPEDQELVRLVGDLGVTGAATRTGNSKAFVRGVRNRVAARARSQLQPYLKDGFSSVPVQDTKLVPEGSG